MFCQGRSKEAWISDDCQGHPKTVKQKHYLEITVRAVAPIIPGIRYAI